MFSSIVNIDIASPAGVLTFSNKAAPSTVVSTIIVSDTDKEETPLSPLYSIAPAIFFSKGFVFVL